MSVESRNGQAARMVGAENLAKEHPKSYHGRIDAFLPYDLCRCQSLHNNRNRADVCKWHFATLQELTL